MKYLWLAAVLVIAACQSAPQREPTDPVRVGPGHVAYQAEKGHGINE